MRPVFLMIITSYFEIGISPFVLGKPYALDSPEEFNSELMAVQLRKRSTDSGANTSTASEINWADPSREKDYIDIKRPLSHPRGISKSVTTVKVDLAFMVCYELSKKFNFNAQALQKYLSYMVTEVNARFSFLEDPKITFRFTGTYFTNSTSAQPYIEIEKKKNEAGGLNLRAVFKVFSEWVGKNIKHLPRHDVLVLLTKETKPHSTIQGVAAQRGPCLFHDYNGGGPRPQYYPANPLDGEEPSRAVAIVLDDGETYRGSFTLVHELGHSLGAPHDGEDEAKDCKPYGNTMGTIGHYRDWHFSNCSKRLFKKFVDSSEAECLRTDATKSFIPLPEPISPNEMCKLLTKLNSSYALDRTTADEYCQRLVCAKFDSGVFTGTLSSNTSAGHHVPCGKGGRCEEDLCKGNQESAKDRLNKKSQEEKKLQESGEPLLEPNQFCQINSNSNRSYALDDTTADEYCQQIVCKVYHPVTNMPGTLTFPTKPKPQSPCGKGGKCVDGICKGNKETPNERLNLNNFCVRKTGNPTAKLYTDGNANDQCERLKCTMVVNGEKDIATYTSQPMNGSFPCGLKGVCQNLKCVGNQEKNAETKNDGYTCSASGCVKTG